MNNKRILFLVLVVLFAATSIVTLLGITKLIVIDEFYLKGLFGAFLIELAAVIFNLVKKGDLLEVDKSGGISNKSSEENKKNIPCPNVGNPPTILTKEKERSLLAELTQWEVVETKRNSGKSIRELHRLYEFKSFNLAFAFMNEVVEHVIVNLDHHPRWENTYNHVEIWLSTFNLDSEISNRDAKLAKAIEDVWASSGKGM